MSRLGTDVLALTCIAGGALVGGAFTLARTVDAEDTRHTVECVQATDVEATSSSVVVSMSGVEGRRAIVVAPRVRVHQPHCVTMGSFEWTERDQERMERARIEMQAAMEKLEAKREQLEGLEFRMEGVDFALDGLGEEISQEIQEALEKEMVRLERELKRLEERGG